MRGEGGISMIKLKLDGEDMLMRCTFWVSWWSVEMHLGRGLRKRLEEALGPRCARVAAAYPPERLFRLARDLRSNFVHEVGDFLSFVF